MGDIKLTRVDPTLPCTAAVVHPEWALEEQARVDASRQRSLSGRLSTVGWRVVEEFRVPLKQVPPYTAALLRAWWSESAPLAFTLDTSHARSTVLCTIANAREPLAEFERPTVERWAGILELAAQRAGPRVGQPFILDDPIFGRLDQSFLTLVE